ncbi:MAG: ComEC/Rec2 family competence protein [Adhaeribacter sp.]
MRIALFFGAGILVYLQVGHKPGFVFPLLAFLLFTYGLAWQLAGRLHSAHWNNGAGLAGLGAIALLGFCTTHYRSARIRPDNLLHLKGEVSYYTGVVQAYTSRKPATEAATLDLRQVQVAGQWRPVSGRVRLTLARQPGARALAYGDLLLVQGAPQEVKPPGNPGQFDYRRYLAYQQTYHQHYRYPGQYLVIGTARVSPVVAASVRARDYLDRQLRRYLPSERDYGVATALVLGIKDYLPDDLKNTYAQTGTMHVLAVSGLHVALLFYVLQLLTSRWGQGRSGRLAAFALLLAVTWFYAFVTALSASVLRAVLMFSFIQAAKAFRLPSNIYNTLAAAAFGLLVYDPYLLVDVGFQLSFLAVYGIVYAQPRIYRLLAVNNLAGDYVWKLVSTSLAAQLAVLPLSLYYFHQFPVYFLVANVVAVTLSNLALLLGFGLLAAAGVPALATLLGTAIAALLQGMNACSEALLRLPGAVVSGITLSSAQAWLFYAGMALLALFMLRRRLFLLAGCSAGVLVCSALELAEAGQQRRQALFVVYQVRGATALGFIRGRQAVLLADSAFYARPRNFQYVVQPHWVQRGVRHMQFDTLSARTLPGLAARRLPDGNLLLSWQGQRLWLGLQPLQAAYLEQLRPHYLVLTQNIKFKPEIFPNKNGRFWVIMDESNKPWYQQKRAAQLRGSGYRVYQVSRQGAFVWWADS